MRWFFQVTYKRFLTHLMNLGNTSEYVTNIAEEERKMEAVLHSYKDKADKNLRKYLGTNEKDAKLSLTFFTVSFAVLLVGGLLGLVQGLERAGLLTLPNWFNYYQVLTVHGVLL